MKLSAPKQFTFGLAVVIALVGIIAKLVSIPMLSRNPGWLLVVAFVILAAGNLVEGL